MSLAGSNNRSEAPPTNHPSRSDAHILNRVPPPTLPSMSSLLNPQASGAEYHQAAPLARQFQPPYNMTKESMWRAQNALPGPLAQHHYPPPPPPPASYFSQSPTEPVLMSQQPPQYNVQHELAVPYQHSQPLAQRRQFKKIKGRNGGYSKDDEIEGFRTSPFQSRSFEQQANQSPEKDASGPNRQIPADPDLSRSRTTAPSQSQSQSTRSLSVPSLFTDASRPRVAPVGPTYSIRMRQQPIAARACGFGERDRRVIDPPPILQMDISDPQASPEELAALIRQPYAVVHCTLWDPVSDTDGTAMPSTTDKRQQRRLMGTLVSSPFVGKDEFNREGCFFTFPDLSVRTPGTYSLRFQLVILSPSLMGVPGSSSPVRSVVNSSTFNVYNAKDFRGMRASTALTKILKSQGCLISVKKGNNRAETQGHEEDDDEFDEGDDAEDDGVGANSSKKAKKPRR